MRAHRPSTQHYDAAETANAKTRLTGGSRSPTKADAYGTALGLPIDAKTQEYQDKLKASLWEQARLGGEPSYAWNEAVVRYLEDTARKASHAIDKTAFTVARRMPERG